MSLLNDEGVVSVYRVLLVDDEQLIVEGLSRVMPWEDMGCRVVGTACDGREGLTLIREKQPDILFTDIRMPNMDGLTMLAAVRSEFPGMQVCVLTAFRDFDYAQEAIRLGVCRYLLKPSKMEELREAVREMTARLDAAAPVRLSEQEREEQSANAGNFIVRSALEYMQEHCTQHITLSDVADNVFVSQWHLSKLINRHMGQSFLDILGGMRIERAKALLKDPSMRIHEVAERAGFSDVAHFSKSFKNLVGKTPGEYRSELK